MAAKTQSVSDALKPLRQWLNENVAKDLTYIMLFHSDALRETRIATNITDKDSVPDALFMESVNANGDQSEIVDRNAQGSGRLVNEVKRVRGWLDQHVPEGFNYVLVLHDNQRGESRLAGNIDSENIPAILFSEGMRATPDEVDDDTTRSRRPETRPGAH